MRCLRRYAGAAIRDADGYAVLFGARRQTKHRVALRIIQCVAHDLADHQPDQPGIRGNRRQILLQVDLYLRGMIHGWPLEMSMTRSW